MIVVQLVHQNKNLLACSRHNYIVDGRLKYTASEHNYYAKK